MSSTIAKIIFPIALVTSGALFAQGNLKQRPKTAPAVSKTILISKSDTVELKSSPATKTLSWAKAKAIYNNNEDSAFIEIMSTSTEECKKLNERFLKLPEKSTYNFWQNHLDSLKKVENFVKKIKR